MTQASGIDRSSTSTRSIPANPAVLDDRVDGRHERRERDGGAAYRDHRYELHAMEQGEDTIPA